jgi:RES domain-containing protein
MPVSPGLTTTIPTAPRIPYYRITSLDFWTPNQRDHHRVVDGQGAVNSLFGARYNFPGVLTVYLAEDLETCFAEKMFYFHREVLRGIDIAHKIGVTPHFQKQFILWEIVLANPVDDVFDMCIPNAASAFNIFPSLTLNPSQDYEHLKLKRAMIQANGYNGLRVVSSRSKAGGKIIVLFKDQSNNIDDIKHYPVDFRLITPGLVPFSNPGADLLDFTSGDVKITGGSFPAGGTRFRNWERVSFNH